MPREVDGPNPNSGIYVTWGATFSPFRYSKLESISPDTFRRVEALTEQKTFIHAWPRDSVYDDLSFGGGSGLSYGIFRLNTAYFTGLTGITVTPGGQSIPPEPVGGGNTRGPCAPFETTAELFENNYQPAPDPTPPMIGYFDGFDAIEGFVDYGA